MANKDYDIIVIGSGPGGYVAAIRAAQLGFSVACIEQEKTLGGTCLNVGCIPSKALLHASEEYSNIQKGIEKYGINVEGLSLDLDTMMEHKNSVVSQLTNGIRMLFEKNKVEHIEGKGKILGVGIVQVQSPDGKETSISTSHIIIATGSKPSNVSGLHVDGRKIVSSTGGLKFEKVPDHLVVVGAGYIGLELGSVWKRLGSKVTVIEYLNEITPGLDKEISQQFQRLLKRQKIKFKLNTKVIASEISDEGINLSLENRDTDSSSSIEADKVLVAAGRKPYTTDLGLEALEIKTNDAGFILIDEKFRTNVDGIYAIGDVVPGPMLAHKAEEEGVALAEIIAGEKPHVNYNTIPSVIYTYPEVASVGKTEEQVLSETKEYKVGTFPFTANGRARAISSTEGFVKIIACSKTDAVLGVHIIGPDAGTLIAEAVIAMEFGGSAEDIARTCHAHPALNEAIKEAALAVDDRAIHF
jgi:dihydrolipoamide dehydrogenase|tara:strand:- start:573 stop:1982 length:1410 start_codon:yes stop_codon:yes gene_type:complete